MENEATAFFKNFQKYMGQVKDIHPDIVKSFSDLHETIMAEGAISGIEKEYIALGIAVAVQCEPCIRLHVQKCVKIGASKEQIMEAASVAVMMAGGPAFTHLAMVAETLESLQD